MKLPLEYVSILCIALSYLTFVQGKGGGGGGGRGGGGARGSGKGSSARALTRSRAAVILGSGAAGYAAYRAHKGLKKDRERGDKENDNSEFDSFEQYVEDPSDYKLQEATSYYASEGIGMSAWALIALILGIVALLTIGWYCCTVFLPIWEDNRRMRRDSMIGRLKDEVPLQETPSTATPSP
ncbi:unnamed protein product [Orchesella dallaii]|uniref:Uncharacterized protein n=1 Tax=Orchesella dallaii TaxID=48710 RepID=A0ABP1S5M3_9HEXA